MSSVINAEDIHYRMVDPRSEEGRKRTWQHQIPLVVVVVAIVVLAAGIISFALWNQIRGVDISAYADTPITVSGLTDSDFTVDAAELAELECVTKTFKGQGQAIDGADNIVTVVAYGPLLTTFLAQYNAEPSDFGRVIIYCNDGYNVVLTSQMLEDEEIVMSIAQGKDALEEWQRPMRFVVPSEQSGNWAYGVERIEFNR